MKILDIIEINDLTEKRKICIECWMYYTVDKTFTTWKFNEHRCFNEAFSSHVSIGVVIDKHQCQGHWPVALVLIDSCFIVVNSHINIIC